MITYIPINFPDIDLLVQGTNLKADKIRVLLHQLFLSRLKQTGYKPKGKKRNKSWYYNKGFVPLKAVILADLLTKKYTHYLSFLEDKGLISCLGSASSKRAYTAGKMSIHYKIPDEYFHNPSTVRHFRKETIKDACTIKAVNRVNGRHEKNNHRGVALESVHQALIVMEKTIRFDITKVETWMQSQTKVIDPMQLELMEAIKNGYFSSSIDVFGERLHTPLKRISRDLRKFMYFKGHENCELASIDICNSQLYFSTLLAHPEIVKRFLPEFHPVIDIFKEYASEEDFLFYTKKCQDGKIYKFWKTVRKKKTRELAKKELIKVLFCSNTSKQRGVKKFARFFPSVYACFRKIKSLNEDQLPFIKETYLDCGVYEPDRYHCNLSCATQRLESRIFLTQIAAACIDKNTGPFVTIHDSIICLKEKRALVEQIIRDEFRKLSLIAPALK